MNDYPPPPKDKQIGIKVNVGKVSALIKKWLRRKKDHKRLVQSQDEVDNARDSRG